MRLGVHYLLSVWATSSCLLICEAEKRIIPRDWGDTPKSLRRRPLEWRSVHGMPDNGGCYGQCA